MNWTILSRDLKEGLSTMFRSTRTRLIISSPYVTKEGTDFVLTCLSQQAHREAKIQILTDLSPINIYKGSTDPMALKLLTSTLQNFRLSHLPKLHAKVYIVDELSAIVTSANLTAGGLERNYEYGVKVQDQEVVQEITKDIMSYSELGAIITSDQLVNYCYIAEHLRATYEKQQQSIVRSVKKEFERELLNAEDELIRLRLAGGAMHTVFAKTILYLLKRCGPLSTEEIHPKIESIHPDLCDNTVDRVIDRKHFGKKWKHAVRSAQQQLKKKNSIFLEGSVWKLTDQQNIYRE